MLIAWQVLVAPAWTRSSSPFGFCVKPTAFPANRRRFQLLRSSLEKRNRIGSARRNRPAPLVWLNSGTARPATIVKGVRAALPLSSYPTTGASHLRLVAVDQLW